MKTRSCCWGMSGVFEPGALASRQHGLEFVSQSIYFMDESKQCVSGCRFSLLGLTEQVPLGNLL